VTDILTFNLFVFRRARNPPTAVLRQIPSFNAVVACMCPVVQAMQQFHCNPAWVAALYDSDMPRTLQEIDSLRGQGTVYGGSEFRRLATNFLEILHNSSGLLDIHHDWLNPFPGVQYAVGVLSGM
jgi:hypothetical protein